METALELKSLSIHIKNKVLGACRLDELGDR